MSEQSHILIIDDEKNYLLVLQTLLEDEGYAVTALNDPETALAFLHESEVDVVVTDMKMPKVSGREVLQQVKKNWPHIPVLIMTAFGSIESAVEAMKYGAFDYITKPFSNDELLLSVHNATELARAHRQYRLLQESMEERYGVHKIVGRSHAIRTVLAMVERAAPSRATVLISGESGTGKELVARAIHYSSPRKDKPFISVNCMALNPGVLESELFGHEKGSFTGAVAMRRGRFEQADGGTLFLDEIAELSPELQVKLLRVLQEKEVWRVGGSTPIKLDVRVMASTNRDLLQMVREGSFRQDLYYRLNILSIHMPPLRERLDDLPDLIQSLLCRINQRIGSKASGITPESMEIARRYSWPGNVRELENVLEQAVNWSNDSVIDFRRIPNRFWEERPSAHEARQGDGPVILQQELCRKEQELLERTLREAGGNRSEAARILGISRSALYRRLEKYKI